MTLPPGFKDNRPQWLKITQPFVAGGLAGSLATCVIQPVDMVKVRSTIMPTERKEEGLISDVSGADPDSRGGYNSQSSGHRS